MANLFVAELGVWRWQLAQICALIYPRCKKRAGRPSPSPTNQSKTRKNSLEGDPKRLGARKGRGNLGDATKTQQNMIAERRVPRHTRNWLSKKAREEKTNDNQSDNTTSDSPDTCACPIRKKQKTSSPEIRSLAPCSKKKRQGCRGPKKMYSLIPSRLGAFL